MLRCGVVLVTCLGMAAPALGGPFVVPVDTSQSTITVELCVAGSCDTDSTPVAGTVTIDLDAIADPAQIWLYDFDLQAVEDMHWEISWGFLGSFTADGTGLGVEYAVPDNPLGPEPVVDGEYVFTGVPYRAEGQIAYHASGIPCAALQGAGYPCDDAYDLAQQGTQTANSFSGAVTTEGRIVTLYSAFDSTQPLDPLNPELGSIHTYGSLYGSVFVPWTVGDLNCDDVVNAFDIDPFVLALSDPAGYEQAYPDCDRMLADINGDGLVNAFDIDPFVALLTGG